MKNEDTKVIDLSAEQQKGILEAKSVLNSKQDVLLKIGQSQALNFIAKLLTVSELKLLQEIKKSKSYAGLTYRDDSGQLLTVSTWDECCQHILKTSRQHIDEKLINLNKFGEEFFESAQSMELGYRDLRKLRQLPQDDQTLVIESEAIDAGDKEAVKDLIDDLTAKHAKEKETLQKRVEESEAVAKARQKLVQTANQQVADKTEELEKLRQTEQYNPNKWLKQVQEINLASTRIMNSAVEAMTQLAELNDTIALAQLSDEHAEQAIELMASVQLHNVEELFMVANNLSYETRERFAAYQNRSRPVHTEEEIIAIEQKMLERM